MDISSSSPCDLIVLMPAFNDWNSAELLIEQLHQSLTAFRHARGSGEIEPQPAVRYLLVNDGSIEPAPDTLKFTGTSAPRVEVLHLRRNLGHQRAIAIGLSWVQANRPSQGIVVMDADGEDTPDGVVRLLERFEKGRGQITVFAARAKRTEPLAFRFFYALYKLLYRMLTGQNVRVGNFSVLARPHLDCLVAVSELWNNYPAAAFKARLDLACVSVDRGYRLAGKSKMNFVSLMTHGLSAISVFADVLGLRLLVATSLLAGASLVGVTAVVAIRLATDWAIPGWATTAVGVLIIVFLQAFSLAILFVFITLQGRSNLGFLPIRDHKFFVGRVSQMPMTQRVASDS